MTRVVKITTTQKHRYFFLFLLSLFFLFCFILTAVVCDEYIEALYKVVMTNVKYLTTVSISHPIADVALLLNDVLHLMRWQKKRKKVHQGQVFYIFKAIKSLII
jgi:hypothetical protein